MKIAVLDDYQDAFRRMPGYSKLSGHEVTVYNDTEKDPAKLAERIRDCEAVVLTQQRSRFPREVIERLPKLKMISQTGRNAYHIDLAACAERGITVSAGVAASTGNSSAATAEIAWALILASMRHIPEEVQRMKEGKWQHTLGRGVYGRTLGIYAYGRIGSIAARIGKGFGMKVVALGRGASTEKAREAGYEVAPSREAFFETCDVISLHLPLNKETRGIVTAQDLARMKPTALIVNTSRAPLIEKGALVAALKKGRPGYAALDVFEEEPLTDTTDPLLNMPNVVCTPHLGYVEDRVYEGIYNVAVDQILAYKAGSPINVVKE